MDKTSWHWQRTVGSQTFHSSSDRELLPHGFVQEAFANEAMYWAEPISDGSLKTMLANSLTLGLYLQKDTDKTFTPIGMARMMTDYTTFAYLDDVYVQSAYRGLGLGVWVIRCCREIVLKVPHMRWMMLLTGSEQAQQLYKRELGMQKIDGQEAPLVCMGARTPTLADAVGQASRDSPSAPSG